MLYQGQTYAEAKEELWEQIHSRQELIRTIQEVVNPLTPQAQDIINLSRENIKRYYNELKVVTKWFKESGMKEDEPYRGKLKKYYAKK